MKWAFAIWLIIWSLLTTMGALGIWEQHRKVTTYQPVSASIVQHTIRQQAEEDFDSARQTRYGPAVSYRYQIDGKKYTSDAVYPTSVRWSGFGAERWARNIAEQFQIGREVTAYVNPSDARQSYLLQKLSFIPYGFFLTGIMAILGGIAIAANEFHSRRRGIVISVFALWILIGILVASHYFLFTTPPFRVDAMTLFVGFQVIGLMILMQQIAPENCVGIVGGLRLGSFLAFVGIWLGSLAGLLVMVASKILEFVGYQPGDQVWISYIVIVTVAILGCVGFAYGFIPDKVLQNRPESVRSKPRV